MCDTINCITKSSVPWPSDWSYDQWVEKKNKYPWLICSDGKIGCEYCKSVDTLKTFKCKGVEISNEWCLTKIDGGSNTIKSTRLTNLRHKILKHKKSKAHIETEKISQQKSSNLLSKAFQTGQSNFYETTQKFFRTAYYISKYNRPYDDHSKLIELQHLNGLNLGTTLHSRYSSTKIISHIADKMKTKIVQNIMATASKISILIDESTTVSSLSGMVVYVKASILSSEPIFIFLDLVELKSQNASSIVSQLIECLYASGFTENFLVEHWVSFVTDGASVLLGKRNGVAVRLKEKYPLIFSWHCLNHRLELAVGDTLKDITATNHFKHFLDSLYSLYSRSPKNQIELKEHCTSLNEIFLKIGKVLDVLWVASSFRTISVIWKIYPALYSHLIQASQDKFRDGKIKSKYSGLSKRLGSIQFLLDLALMCDVLFEISQLSLDLQKQDMSLLQADVLIRRTIRVIESLKTMNGNYFSEAVKAKEKMIFKTVVLSNNEKITCINKNQFITSVVNNLNMRLIPNEGEEKIILEDFQIFDKKLWPSEVEIRFGEKEIQRICDRFCINKVKTLKGMRIYIDDNDNNDITLIEELNDINILIKTLPCSTAECERGFSVMNNICTDLRSRLLINNISNSMFININGPPLQRWNPRDYVESWLTSHRDADDNKSRKVNTSTATEDPKYKLWQLL